MTREVCELNRIVRFEIPVEDTEKAREFFHTVFGWDIRTRTGPWGSMIEVLTGSGSGPYIGGSFFRKSAVPPEFSRIINIIEIHDTETMKKEVEEHGGQIVFGPIQYADLGKMTYFKDTEGNILGMLEQS